MGVELRRAVAADAEVCSRIICEAFTGIAERHGFAPAFPSLDVARRVATLFLELPTMYGLVAVSDDHVVGAVFFDEGDPIRGGRHRGGRPEPRRVSKACGGERLHPLAPLFEGKWA